MQRAPAHFHHLQLPQNTLAEVLQEEELRMTKHTTPIVRRNNGIVVIHLMISLLHQYERQCFNKGKQGKDKEMA